MNSRLSVIILLLFLLAGCGEETPDEEDSKDLPEIQDQLTLPADELDMEAAPEEGLPDLTLNMENEDISEDESSFRNLYREDATQRNAGTETEFLVGWEQNRNTRSEEDDKVSAPIFRDGVFIGSVTISYKAPLTWEESGTVFATSERITGYTSFRIPSLIYDQTMAERGDAKAQFNMGVRFLQGEGVPQHMAEAFEWFRESAEQGFAYAQFNLGLMYDKGQGIEQNLEEAAYWYSQSAEQDNPRAQNNLGLFYLFGDGVQSDIEAAIDWITRSASLGNPKAQYNLGNLYNLPDTSFSDNSMAAYLWTLAANQGHVMAQTNLAQAYLTGLDVAYDPYRAYKWAYIANILDPGNPVIQNHLQTAFDFLYMRDILKAEEEAEAWLARFGETPVP